jgi:hypothetical protein
MSTLTDILSADLSSDLSTLTPEAIDALLAKGTSLLASVSDPAVKAGLTAVLGTLSTPAAKATLTQFATHEVRGAITLAGLKLDAAGRAAFVGEASFAQRHSMVNADDQAARQAIDSRAALVSGLESLALDVITKGSIAALPFLLAIL